MKEEQKQKIIVHGEDLNRIFNTGLNPLVLCKKLHRLEVKAHKLAEDYCNGIITPEFYERQAEKIEKALDKILNYTGKRIAVFINSDPRGYALKISDNCVWKKGLKIHRDMGGYGIICPEIN